MLAALRDSEHGPLYVFADEGQLVFARQGPPTVVLVGSDFDENLRNTKQIAGAFCSLAASRMTFRGGSGVPVRFVPCSTDDAVRTADDEAAALLAEGWPSEAVALLATHHRHPVLRRAAGRRPTRLLGVVLGERRPLLRARARLQGPRASGGRAGGQRLSR